MLPGADRMVVFQQGALFPWKTVLWNVTCGPIQQGKMSRSDAELQARELLRASGCDRSKTSFRASFPAA